ncbi:unnamed protein product [Adineta steineri]|uniref:Uncharacterized protein n=1 Tax=Adineta steineri TaxID=433720 RepID=A0A814CSR1_9BILA|nr:unnamed protein product [Adineta steineri]CAF1202362.1 unnamed protein product [Adineta steineri]
MANADEFCQYARLGQTSKIQKSLQIHNVDINALNIYGESALSTATYYNQVLSVECLLANKADPKLRLSAGHTAIHIACRLANVPILHLLLSIRKDLDCQDEEQQQQKKEDKHLYECLRIKDHANLTPVHWAATQESVTKRQKVFAYLDKRMPGVLDSRYDLNWFSSWAKIHPWVIGQKTTKNNQQLVPKLTNTDRINRQYCDSGSSLPLTNNMTPMNVTSRTSLNNYERTIRQPQTATTSGYYDDIYDKNKHILSNVEHLPQVPPLPITPITSCIVTSTHSILKNKHKTNEQHCESAKSSSGNNDATGTNSQKTPYSQRLTSIIKHSLSPLIDRSTFRAERAQVIPTFHFPPTLSTIENKTAKEHDYEDMVTPISSKRPSHNLLLNIVPSSTTPSSDHSSGRQSRRPFGSFGFDTHIDPRIINETITLSTIELHTPNDESLYDDDDIDYLCKSASTLDISTPGAYTYNI